MRFRVNDRGVADVVHSAGVARFLDDAADVIVDGVESRAPERTGHFEGSITKTRPERRGANAGITVYSTDFAAHLVEFGSQNNPAYAPFRRTASAFGLRLRSRGTRR